MTTYKIKAKKNIDKTQLVAVRLPLSHLKLLDKLAMADSENVSSLFRDAVREYLIKRGQIEAEEVQK